MAITARAAKSAIGCPVPSLLKAALHKFNKIAKKFGADELSIADARAGKRPTAGFMAFPGDVPVEDAVNWTKVGEQAGSTKGGFFRDGAGVVWYVKRQDLDHIANEMTAFDFYKAAGFDVPDVKRITWKGKDASASRVIDGLTGSGTNPKHLTGTQEGFALDAWMANWDSVGIGTTKYDNILDLNGTAVRVDAGGALLYRGTGGPKGKYFDELVTEWTGLRDPSINPVAATVYGDIPDDVLRASALKVVNFTDDQIRVIVHSRWSHDLDTADKLVAKMIARRDAVRKHLDAMPPPKVDPPLAFHDLTDDDLDEILKVDSSAKFSDDRLLAILRKLWGDQSVPVVSDEAFDALGGPSLYRGVGKVEHLDANLNGTFIGKGQHGNGQYFSTSDAFAGKYGGPDGWVYEVKLAPTAKISTWPDLYDDMRAFETATKKTKLHKVVDVIHDEDPRITRWVAAVKGIDAISVDDEIVVLNQRMLRARVSRLPAKYADAVVKIDEAAGINPFPKPAVMHLPPPSPTKPPPVHLPPPKPPKPPAVMIQSQWNAVEAAIKSGDDNAIAAAYAAYKGLGDVPLPPPAGGLNVVKAGHWKPPGWTAPKAELDEAWDAVEAALKEGGSPGPLIRAYNRWELLGGEKAPGGWMDVRKGWKPTPSSVPDTVVKAWDDYLDAKGTYKQKFKVGPLKEAEQKFTAAVVAAGFEAPDTKKMFASFGKKMPALKKADVVQPSALPPGAFGAMPALPDPGDAAAILKADVGNLKDEVSEWALKLETRAAAGKVSADLIDHAHKVHADLMKLVDVDDATWTANKLANADVVLGDFQNAVKALAPAGDEILDAARKEADNIADALLGHPALAGGVDAHLEKKIRDAVKALEAAPDDVALLDKFNGTLDTAKKAIADAKAMPDELVEPWVALRTAYNDAMAGGGGYGFDDALDAFNDAQKAAGLKTLSKGDAVEVLADMRIPALVSDAPLPTTPPGFVPPGYTTAVDDLPDALKTKWEKVVAALDDGNQNKISGTVYRFNKAADELGLPKVTQKDVKAAWKQAQGPLPDAPLSPPAPAPVDAIPPAPPGPDGQAYQDAWETFVRKVKGYEKGTVPPMQVGNALTEFNEIRHAAGYTALALSDAKALIPSPVAGVPGLTVAADDVTAAVAKATKLQDELNQFAGELPGGQGATEVLDLRDEVMAASAKFQADQTPAALDDLNAIIARAKAKLDDGSLVPAPAQPSPPAAAADIEAAVAKSDALLDDLSDAANQMGDVHGFDSELVDNISALDDEIQNAATKLNDLKTQKALDDLTAAIDSAQAQLDSGDLTAGAWVADDAVGMVDDTTDIVVPDELLTTLDNQELEAVRKRVHKAFMALADDDLASDITAADDLADLFKGALVDAPDDVIHSSALVVERRLARLANDYDDVADALKFSKPSDAVLADTKHAAEKLIDTFHDAADEPDDAVYKLISALQDAEVGEVGYREIGNLQKVLGEVADTADELGYNIPPSVVSVLEDVGSPPVAPPAVTLSPPAVAPSATDDLLQARIAASTETESKLASAWEIATELDAGNETGNLTILQEAHDALMDARAKAADALSSGTAVAKTQALDDIAAAMKKVDDAIEATDPLKAMEAAAPGAAVPAPTDAPPVAVAAPPAADEFPASLLKAWDDVKKEVAKGPENTAAIDAATDVLNVELMNAGYKHMDLVDIIEEANFDKFKPVKIGATATTGVAAVDDAIAEAQFLRSKLYTQVDDLDAEQAIEIFDQLEEVISDLAKATDENAAAALATLKETSQEAREMLLGINVVGPSKVVDDAWAKVTALSGEAPGSPALAAAVDDFGEALTTAGYKKVDVSAAVSAIQSNKFPALVKMDVADPAVQKLIDDATALQAALKDIGTKEAAGSHLDLYFKINAVKKAEPETLAAKVTALQKAIDDAKAITDEVADDIIDYDAAKVAEKLSDELYNKELHPNLPDNTVKELDGKLQAAAAKYYDDPTPETVGEFKLVADDVQKILHEDDLSEVWRAYVNAVSEGEDVDFYAVSVNEALENLKLKKVPEETLYDHATSEWFPVSLKKSAEPDHAAAMTAWNKLKAEWDEPGKTIDGLVDELNEALDAAGYKKVQLEEVLGNVGLAGDDALPPTLVPGTTPDAAIGAPVQEIDNAWGMLHQKQFGWPAVFDEALETVNSELDKAGYKAISAADARKALADGAKPPMLPKVAAGTTTADDDLWQQAIKEAWTDIQKKQDWPGEEMKKFNEILEAAGYEPLSTNTILHGTGPQMTMPALKKKPGPPEGLLDLFLGTPPKPAGGPTGAAADEAWEKLAKAVSGGDQSAMGQALQDYNNLSNAAGIGPLHLHDAILVVQKPKHPLLGNAADAIADLRKIHASTLDEAAQAGDLLMDLRDAAASAALKLDNLDAPATTAAIEGLQTVLNQVDTKLPAWKAAKEAADAAADAAAALVIPPPPAHPQADNVKAAWKKILEAKKAGGSGVAELNDYNHLLTNQYGMPGFLPQDVDDYLAVVKVADDVPPAVPAAKAWDDVIEAHKDLPGGVTYGDPEFDVFAAKVNDLNLILAAGGHTEGVTPFHAITILEAGDVPPGVKAMVDAALHPVDDAALLLADDDLAKLWDDVVKAYVDPDTVTEADPKWAAFENAVSKLNAGLPEGPPKLTTFTVADEIAAGTVPHQVAPHVQHPVVKAWDDLEKAWAAKGDAPMLPNKLPEYQKFIDAVDDAGKPTLGLPDVTSHLQQKMKPADVLDLIDAQPPPEAVTPFKAWTDVVAAHDAMPQGTVMGDPAWAPFTAAVKKLNELLDIDAGGPGKVSIFTVDGAIQEGGIPTKVKKLLAAADAPVGTDDAFDAALATVNANLAANGVDALDKEKVRRALKAWDDMKKSYEAPDGMITPEAVEAVNSAMDDLGGPNATFGFMQDLLDAGKKLWVLDDFPDNIPLVPPAPSKPLNPVAKAWDEVKKAWDEKPAGVEHAHQLPEYQDLQDALMAAGKPTLSTSDVTSSLNLKKVPDALADFVSPAPAAPIPTVPASLTDDVESFVGKINDFEPDGDFVPDHLANDIEDALAAYKNNPASSTLHDLKTAVDDAVVELSEEGVPEEIILIGEDLTSVLDNIPPPPVQAAVVDKLTGAVNPVAKAWDDVQAAVQNPNVMGAGWHTYEGKLKALNKILDDAGKPKLNALDVVDNYKGGGVPPAVADLIGDAAPTPAPSGWGTLNQPTAAGQAKIDAAWEKIVNVAEGAKPTAYLAYAKEVIDQGFEPIPWKKTLDAVSEGVAPGAYTSKMPADMIDAVWDEFVAVNNDGLGLPTIAVYGKYKKLMEKAGFKPPDLNDARAAATAGVQPPLLKTTEGVVNAQEMWAAVTSTEEEDAFKHALAKFNSILDDAGFEKLDPTDALESAADQTMALKLKYPVGLGDLGKKRWDDLIVAVETGTNEQAALAAYKNAVEFNAAAQVKSLDDIKLLVYAQDDPVFLDAVITLKAMDEVLATDINEGLALTIKNRKKKIVQAIAKVWAAASDAHDELAKALKGGKSALSPSLAAVAQEGVEAVVPVGMSPTVTTAWSEFVQAVQAVDHTKAFNAYAQYTDNVLAAGLKKTDTSFSDAWELAKTTNKVQPPVVAPGGSLPAGAAATPAAAATKVKLPAALADEWEKLKAATAGGEHAALVKVGDTPQEIQAVFQELVGRVENDAPLGMTMGHLNDALKKHGFDTVQPSPASARSIAAAGDDAAFIRLSKPATDSEMAAAVAAYNKVAVAEGYPQTTVAKIREGWQADVVPTTPAVITDSATKATPVKLALLPEDVKFRFAGVTDAVTHGSPIGPRVDDLNNALERWGFQKLTVADARAIADELDPHFVPAYPDAVRAALDDLTKAIGQEDVGSIVKKHWDDAVAARKAEKWADIHTNIQAANAKLKAAGKHEISDAAFYLDEDKLPPVIESLLKHDPAAQAKTTWDDMVAAWNAAEEVKNKPDYPANWTDYEVKMGEFRAKLNDMIGQLELAGLPPTISEMGAAVAIDAGTVPDVVAALIARKPVDPAPALAKLNKALKAGGYKGTTMTTVKKALDTEGYSAFKLKEPKLVPAKAVTSKGAPGLKTTVDPDLTAAQQLAKADEPLDVAGWTQVGEQGGSNPGGMFQGSTGEKWYVKWIDKEHAQNERLAAKLYEKLGIDVPEIRLAKGADGKTGIASRIIDDLSNQRQAIKDVAGAQEGFVADAWLANWDVVGMEYDNLLAVGGKAYRVDTGGALLYRAQGGAKGNLFKATVDELDSLRTASVNAQSAGVFGDITEAKLKAGARRVTALTDTEIRELVEQYGPGTAASRKALADKLIDRRDDIARRILQREVPTARRVHPVVLGQGESLVDAQAQADKVLADIQRLVAAVGLPYTERTELAKLLEAHLWKASTNPDNATVIRQLYRSVESTRERLAARIEQLKAWGHDVDRDVWPLSDTDLRQLVGDDDTPFKAIAKPWLDALSSQDRSATRRYTGSFYDELNDALRDDDWQRYATYVERIDRALGQAPTTRPDIVWRSITDGRKFRDNAFDPDALTVGRVVKLKGYQSCTVRPGSYGGGGSYMFEIRPASGGYVRAISHHPDEYEYLMPRDRCYKFMGKKDLPWKPEYGGQTTITLYQFMELPGVSCD